MDKMDKIIDEKEAAQNLDQLRRELAAVRKACFIAGFLPPLPYTVNDKGEALYKHSDVLAEHLRRAKE